MMSVNNKTAKAQQGFSVIELMISLVLGLLLTTGITKVYLTTKDTYNLSENMARMQESARFTINMLSQDIRMAGFLPCRINGNFSNTLNGSETFFNFFDQAIVGYDGGSPASFPATFPDVGTNPGDRVAGTDAVVILRGDDSIFKVTNHNPVSAQFKINDLHDLQSDDIAMVCDGDNAAIFQLTNVNSSNVTVVHNTGTGSIGNCTKSLGGNGNCADQTGLIAHTYGPESQLVKFRAVGYYIGVSASGDTSSLYRRRWNSGAFIYEELLTEIESMQLAYGLDVSGGVEPERYVTANDVSDWKEVMSVKIGLLAHTPDPINKINDTNTYMVAGTAISDTGLGLKHAGDQRLRTAYNNIVKIRNRGLN